MNETQAGRDPEPALIAEATKRAGVIWVEVGGRPARAAWHVWAQGAPQPGSEPQSPGAAYVLTGPGEQELPGLAEAERVNVMVPGREPGSGLVRWIAAVAQVEPDGAEWKAVIGPLLAGRLNEPLDPGETSPAQRWARTCAVFRLQPV